MAYSKQVIFFRPLSCSYIILALIPMLRKQENKYDLAFAEISLFFFVLITNKIDKEDKKVKLNT